MSIFWQTVAVASNIAAFALCLVMLKNVMAQNSTPASNTLSLSTSHINLLSNNRNSNSFCPPFYAIRRWVSNFREHWSKQRQLRFYTILFCLGSIFFHCIDYTSILLDFYLAGGVDKEFTSSSSSSKNTTAEGSKQCFSEFCTRSAPIVLLPSAIYTLCVNCIIAFHVACVIDRYYRLDMVIAASFKRKVIKKKCVKY